MRSEAFLCCCITLGLFICCGLSSPVPSGFCDGVKQPGRYCFRNLTGWHDCVLDKAAGKIKDRVHYCRSQTRCACYFGPVCPKSLPDPCTRYETPPSLPDSFTLTFAGVRSICSRSSCQNIPFGGLRYVDNKNGGRYRQDLVSDAIISTYIIPSGRNLTGFQTDWQKQTCTRLTFPKYLGFKIPGYFSFDNEEMIDGRLAKRWFWYEERMTPVPMYITMYIYSVRGTKPGETYLIRMAQKVFLPQSNVHNSYNETYTIFKTEKHDDTRFELPAPCQAPTANRVTLNTDDSDREHMDHHIYFSK